MSAEGRKRSSLAVYADTRQRFLEAKPYDSLSDDEFVEVLLEKWEGRR